MTGDFPPDFAHDFPPGLDCRQLSPAELPLVIALHHRIRAELPPQMIAHETDEFFDRHLETCGRIFGCFDGDRMIAYGVLGLPRPGDPNFGVDHGLAAASFQRVAHLDGAAVVPDRQGQGLQRAISRRRIEEAKQHQRDIILSTVAPTNTSSLANLLASGMIICGVAQKFGGVRFLMRRDLQAAALPAGAAPPEGSRWSSRADETEIRSLLDQGYRGVALDSDAGNTILMIPPLMIAPGNCGSR